MNLFPFKNINNLVYISGFEENEGAGQGPQKGACCIKHSAGPQEKVPGAEAHFQNTVWSAK